MRTINNRDHFTPLGIWIQENCRHDMTVTNLDYVIYDYKNKQVMLVEEKQSGGVLHTGQKLAIRLIHQALTIACPQINHHYRGFNLVQFPRGSTMPGLGMKLNNIPITAEALAAHLNFELQAIEPYNFNKN